MKILFIISILLSPLYLFAAEHDAQVVRVVDGDTVVLRWDNTEEKVRIIGIDTPEIVARNRPIECFGSQASDHAAQLLPLGSFVTFVFDGEYDRYDRALGYITLSDGRDFGYIMISDGYAYAYRSFDHNRIHIYTFTESLARLNQRGLWAPNACRTAPQSIQQTQSTWEQYTDMITDLSNLVQKIINLL